MKLGIIYCYSCLCLLCNDIVAGNLITPYLVNDAFAPDCITCQTASRFIISILKILSDFGRIFLFLAIKINVNLYNSSRFRSDLNSEA